MYVSTTINNGNNGNNDNNDNIDNINSHEKTRSTTWRRKKKKFPASIALCTLCQNKGGKIPQKKKQRKSKSKRYNIS